MFGLEFDDFQTGQAIRCNGNFLFTAEFWPEANVHLLGAGCFLDAQFGLGDRQFQCGCAIFPEYVMMTRQGQPTLLVQIVGVAVTV